MVDNAYIHQKEPPGLGQAVLMAKDVVGNEPFAVFLADDIIRSQTPVVKQMMEAYAQQQVSVLALQRDRKSTRLNSSHSQNLVCRLLLEKKNPSRLQTSRSRRP